MVSSLLPFPPPQALSPGLFTDSPGYPEGPPSVGQTLPSRALRKQILFSSLVLLEDQD